MILFSGCGLGFVLFWGFFTHMLIGDVYARGQYIYAAQLLEIHEYFEEYNQRFNCFIIIFSNSSQPSLRR